MRPPLTALIFCWLLLSTGKAEPSVPASALSPDIRAALQSLSSRPTLASWKTSHPSEHVDLAHPSSDKDRYPVEYLRETRWCATAVSTAASGTLRAANFIIPEVHAGTLPPLPEPSAALTDDCQLFSVWFDSPGGMAATQSLTSQLQSAWGPPDIRDPQGLQQMAAIRGSGFWQNVSLWHRGTFHIWVATLNGSFTLRAQRTVAWMIRDLPQDSVQPLTGFDVRAYALHLAGLNSASAPDLRPDADCPKQTHAQALTGLSRLLRTARSLPPSRRAAALLAADLEIPCALANSSLTPQDLNRLHIPLAVQCLNEGPSYGGSLRRQAQKLDPHGPIGTLVSFAEIAGLCNDSPQWWQRTLDRGSRLRAHAEGQPWAPWLSVALAQAHTVKMLYTPPRLHPAERAAAIAEWQAFLQSVPPAPENARAREIGWTAAWRLLAGLPPASIHFGCDCE